MAASCVTKIVQRIVYMLLLGLVAAPLLAAEQRYDYDPLGRLVQSTSDGNRVEYRYDAAGNLLEVSGDSPVVAPSISSVTPDAIRRGEQVQVNLSGNGLSYASVSSPSEKLIVSSVSAQAESLSFMLAVAADTPLVTQNFLLTNAAGSVGFDIEIMPHLPVMSAVPLPLAIPPDNTPHSFSIKLSNADNLPHTIYLASSNPAIALVSPTSLTLAAGQTQAIASITGVSAGSASLQLSSSSLEDTAVPVFVTTEFAGINTSHAQLLGVVLETSSEPQTETKKLSTPADVGVVLGGHLRDLAPSAVNQGSNITLNVTGKGLDMVANVSLLPADGVTLGSFVAAESGLSASLSVNVAADAATGLRQLILQDAEGVSLAAARADSDRLLISYPEPIIASISPLFGTVGSPISMTLRGQNLQQGKVALYPGTAIQVDATPSVSADGRSMTLTLGIGSLTALGEHTVVVSTPGGSSSTSPGPENTFTVVTSIDEILTPIAAPQLGVVLESEATSSEQSYGLHSMPLGVSLGPIVSEMSPHAAIIGETITLTLQGKELAGVTGLTFSPAEGLSLVGEPSVTAESVTANVQIAADAAQTLRGVKVWVGDSEVWFNDPRQSQFLVTPPLPQIESVSPQNVEVGSGPITLTVRGENFTGASLLMALPDSGVTIGQPPVVNVDATEITATITVAPDAAIGSRVIEVTTPAGTTDNAPTAANTIHIVNALGDTITPVQAAQLGVVLQSDTVEPPGYSGFLASSELGVMLQTEPPPAPEQDIFLENASLGVALGPFAHTLTTSVLRPGIDGSLSVTGMGLDSVTSVSVSPATGITLAAPVTQLDGSAMSIPLTLANDVAAGPKQLILNNGGSRILFSDASQARFVVAAGEPQMDSISPILSPPGETVTLVIRGANLDYAQVLVEPVAGIVFSGKPTSNADGTELTIGMYVPSDADLGARVIRVQTPGGLTTDQPEPANTFTVYQP